METINYYTLNQAQHFPFPHDNADMYTDEELWNHYIGTNYLCVHLIKQLGHKGPIHSILDKLEQHSHFKEYAVAWMRLKFLCEVMEPSYILKKRDPTWQKPNSPMMKEPCVEIWSWTGESLTERYYTIDVVANILGQHLFAVVKAYVFGLNPPKTTDEVANAVKTFNKSLYEVRGQSLGQIQWNLWNPRDLVPYAWAMYLIKAWSAFSVLLPIIETT
jgi:hypothetical protein